MHNTYKTKIKLFRKPKEHVMWLKFRTEFHILMAVINRKESKGKFVVGIYLMYKYKWGQ